MKSFYRICLLIFLGSNVFFQPLMAWWDAGHLAVAQIAYDNLKPEARKEADRLTQILAKDYPYLNHFIALAPWPDDLKNDGIRAYDSWHYTNIPYNPYGVALPPRPEVDVIWAIRECQKVLRSNDCADVEKARFLAFLVHFVGDIHQPLHTTTMYSQSQPGGNIGGNTFRLKGEYSSLHKLWDDGAGFLSKYNDINPYREPNEALEDKEIKSVQKLAREVSAAYPRKAIRNVHESDPDFWALEGHKLAVQYAYKGVNGEKDGYTQYLKSGGTPSELYLNRAKEVVKERLAAGGYRLAALLNQLLSPGE